MNTIALTKWLSKITPNLFITSGLSMLHLSLLVFIGEAVRDAFDPRKTLQ